MNQHTGLNLLQRAVALCLAAMVTVGLLGGIDQLAQQPQLSDAWAAKTVSVPRA
jgi:hypothetical protein